jgi:hypothetical protein
MSEKTVEIHAKRDSFESVKKAKQNYGRKLRLKS